MNVSNYKAIVYGEPKCGKQTLIKKLTNDKRQLVIEDKTINAQYIFEFQINNMEPDEDALCLIYVVDLTAKDSLDNIDSLFFTKINKDNIPIKNISILVGNKLDLEDDRKIDQDDIQTYAVDNGMLVQEVSCLNNGTNIETLIRQISNKAKFLLKNQTKKVAVSKSPRTFRENIMLNQKEKSQELPQVDTSQSIKPSSLNTSQANQIIIKPKDTKDVRKDQKDIEKSRQNTVENEGSSSPQRKKFDFKDKLKQFTKKRDNSEEDRPLPPEPAIIENKKEEQNVTTKQIQDMRQSLKKVEVTNNLQKTNNQPKPQENNSKNEFLSKFQKITQKSELNKTQEIADQNEKGKQTELEKQFQQKEKEKEQKSPIISSQIKKFENVEIKQDIKIQPSRASVVKRNSISNNNEMQLVNSNSRNSISSNKQNYSSKKSITEVDQKVIGNINKSLNDKNTSNPSSHQSQRSDQNNNSINQGGANLLESMYKNKIVNTNKLPPTSSISTKPSTQEVKNSVKFQQQDEVIDYNKRKNSDINSNKNIGKESFLDKKLKSPNETTQNSKLVSNNIEQQEDQTKKKVSPLDLLKLKPTQTNANNTTQQTQINQQKETQKVQPQEENNTSTFPFENKDNKQKEETKLTQSIQNQVTNQPYDSKKLNESTEHNKLEQKRKISSKNEMIQQRQPSPIQYESGNQNSKLEQKRKVSSKNDSVQSKQQQKSPIQQEKETEQKSLYEEENEGRILPTPQINVLQCSSSPKQRNNNNPYKNTIASAQNSTSAKKSSNSLNEYLENENLVNDQNKLLAELIQQPISSDRKNPLIDSEYATQNEDPQHQQNHKLQQHDIIAKNGNKLVKSDYSDANKTPMINGQNPQSHQFPENMFLNMPNQLKIYESTVINKNNMNPEFYRASFDDVPNIMNPSSNDSSMVHPNGDDEVSSKEKFENKQPNILLGNDPMQNNSQIYQAQQNQINQQSNQNQLNTFSNDPNFNSFSLKDPALIQQFSISNQSINTQIVNQQNQQNLIQYQSFQDKQGIIPEIKLPSIQQQHPSAQQSIHGDSQISQHQQSTYSPQQSIQQNSYQSQQQALDALYHLQLNSQKQQQSIQQPTGAFNTNEIQKSSIQQQQYLQNNQYSQNSQKTLTQSPPIQQQMQVNQDYLNQFGSQLSMGNGGMNQNIGNLSFQNGNQQDQELLLQQLLKQMQQNQQTQQNQLTTQLIQQLLLNQQINSNPIAGQKGLQGQIPSQFSFTQNPLNRQYSPYQHGSQQQLQYQMQNPYTSPFDQQMQLGSNSIQGIQQKQIQNHQPQSQLIVSPNHVGQPLYLQQNNIQNKLGMNEAYTYPPNNQILQNQSQQQEKSTEDFFGNASKYSNNPEQDGKVSRFSIHTNNKTPEPGNQSGLNHTYLDNYNQFKDNSVMIADVEMRFKNNQQDRFQQIPQNTIDMNNNYQYSPQSLERKPDIRNVPFLNNKTIEENNYPQFGGREYLEGRGRTMYQNNYYNQQFKGIPSDRQFTPSGFEDNYERGNNQKRDTSEGLRKSYQDFDGNKYPYQTRDFQNSSHIDELLREVNNISVNKSIGRNKQSTSQSQIRSHRNQYNDGNNGNTSNILLNISSNINDKSVDETSELNLLDKNIKALEESIEDLDSDLRQGRIQQKIKSKRDYSNNQNNMKELDTSAPLLDGNGLGQYTAASTLRSRSQNEKSPNIERQQHAKKQSIAQQFSSIGEENGFVKNNGKLNQKHGPSHSSIPVYETNLLSSRKSPQKEQLVEEIQLTLGKPQPQQQTQRFGKLQSKENAEIITEVIFDNEGSEFDDQQNSMVFVDISQDVATQRHSSRPATQNFHSKKSKSILQLNIDFDHQKFTIDIYGDDTSFSVAERFFTSLNKTASRNQIKKLSQIIERIINKYCQDLAEVVEKIEQKKLKEKDTLECFIREKNFVQASSINNKNYETSQVLSTRRNTSNNATRQSQEVIGKIKIDYHKKQLILAVHEFDEPHEIAFNFIQQNNLPKNKINYLVEQISQIQQTSQQKKKAIESQKSNSNNGNLEVHFSPTHHGIGRYYGQLTNQSMNSSFIGSPNKFQSPSKNLDKKSLLFQIKFDMGNGQFINLPVHKNDNLKKLAFDASQNYKLTHEQYTKIYDCLEKTYKVKRESSWTRVYSKK